MRQLILLILICLLAQSAIAQTYGSFTDPRDGQVYKTVKIGNQIWMAENLNYALPGSMCYENRTDFCDLYGRLYKWEDAQKACPPGWRLPYGSEVVFLLHSYPSREAIYSALIDGGNSGFNAKLGGTFDYGHSSPSWSDGFSSIGEYGKIWYYKMKESKTPWNIVFQNLDLIDYDPRVYLYPAYGIICHDDRYKSGISCRCVKE